jgi:hypothetical protein
MAEPVSTATSGTIAWLCDPSNLTGYNLYPDLKENDEFDAITKQMCSLSTLDYGFLVFVLSYVHNYEDSTNKIYVIV